MKIFEFPAVILTCRPGREALSSKDFTFSPLTAGVVQWQPWGLRKGAEEGCSLGPPPARSPCPPIPSPSPPLLAAAYLGIGRSLPLRAARETASRWGAVQGNHVFPIKTDRCLLT